jgi:dynein heavy chain
MFGLHPNAEIGYLTTQGETLFATIQAVSGGSASGGSDNSGISRIITDFLTRLPPTYNMMEI